jgi:hypothetical protein
MVPDSALGRGGLRCHRVSQRLQNCSRCQRALALPRAPWHRARHLPDEGSDVTTCPTAPNPPPGTEGSDVTTCLEGLSPPPGRGALRSRHVSHDSRTVPCTGRLWHSHKYKTLGPPPSRAPVSPRVLWLQTHLPMRECFGAATCPVALSL